jgi:hypothetical protein
VLSVAKIPFSFALAYSCRAEVCEGGWRFQSPPPYNPRPKI